MDLGEIGWGSVEWVHLAQDRGRWRAVVNTVMNLRVLEGHGISYLVKSKRLQHTQNMQLERNNKNNHHECVRLLCNINVFS
jgi:hypothetical protein